MNNLKKLREARGLTQQKLAKQFRLTQQAIHKYENGLAEPDIKTMKSIADFFHTTIDYLVGFSQEYDTDQPPFMIESTPVNAAEYHHMFLYNKLSTEAKKNLDSILENFLSMLEQ